MNTIEYLEVCAEEEAGEVAVAALGVAKAISKALRFGLTDINPERLQTATEVLVAELNDLEAVVEMLQEAGVKLPGLHDREAIEAKKKKVSAMVTYSAKVNGLTSVTPHVNQDLLDHTRGS